MTLIRTDTCLATLRLRIQSVRHIVAALLVIFLSPALPAQVFQNFLDHSGAPVTTIMGITQDQQGFMWFATTEGLYRYDTRTFRPFAPNATDSGAIPSSYINDVVCDSRGTVWALTSSGLSRYDRQSDSFTTFRHETNNPGTLTGDYVLSMAEDLQRTGYWVGTSAGLDYLAFRDGKPVIRRMPLSQFEPRSRRVRCLTQTPDGTLWLGTYDGLISMRGDGSHQQIYRIQASQSDPDYPSINEFNTIYADGKGNIWLGSNRAGLIRFQIANQTFHIINAFSPSQNELPNVSKILPEKTGKYWIATWSGLALFDPITQKAVWYTHQDNNPLSISDDLLYALFQDRQGGIWTGNYYSGISYMFPRQSAMTVAQPWGPFKAARLGRTKKGDIWGVNEKRSLLSVYNPGTGTLTNHVLRLPFPITYNGFHLDDDLVLWCGGTGVLTGCNLRTGEQKSYPLPEHAKQQGAIGSVFEDSRGRLWLCDPFRLLLFDKQTRKFYSPQERISPKQGIVYDIQTMTEDSRGNIWLGGWGDLLLLKPNATNFERISVDASAEPGKMPVLSAACEDHSGRMWFALGQHGLQVYDPARKRLVRQEEIGGFVLDVQSDPAGFLWINHSSRLLRYHPLRKTRQFFDYLDGLPLNGILRAATSARDGSNRLYWATTKGIFSFLPDNGNLLSYPSPPVFTSLRLFDQEVRAGDSTRLLDRAIGEKQGMSFRHDQNSFTVSFALLSYFRSDRNQYAYQLEGFDGRWHQTDSPLATFTNLPAGNYTLLIKAADGEGHWNPAPARLKITIRPAWWQTWYAYVLYFVAFVGLLFWAIRYFWLQKAHQKDRELFLAKLDFFTNLSHEIRTHLSLIAAPLEKALESVYRPDDLKTFLGYAQASSATLINLVNELLDFRKIQSGNQAFHVAEQDIGSLIRQVVSSFEYKALERGVTTHLELGRVPLLLWFDSVQLQKVLYNLLSNAYKYTRTNGNVRVSVAETDSEVFITVTDDGDGIAAEHLAHLFTNFYQVRDNAAAGSGYGIGLALAYEIARRHRGDLSVSSRQATPSQAGQTSFSLTLRKGSAHFLPLELGQTPVTSVNQPLLPEQDTRPGRHTILLIEDNDVLRAFERDALRDRFSILEAAGGIEALALANLHLPDLIVSDIMLPAMDGISLCRTLKSQLETNHIPVILLSARGDTSQIREGLEAGADDYLVKPFDMQALALKIDNLIQVRETLKLRYSRARLLEPGEITVDDKDGRFVGQLKDLVLENLSDSEFGVDEMAREIGTSVSVLYRKLRSITGMTVNDFTKTLRMKRAMQLLESGAYTISEVSLLVGYESARHFSREFKKAFGKTPQEIRKKDQ